MMERSSKFISLSGFTGVFAGIFALAGGAVAYFYCVNSFGPHLIIIAYIISILILLILLTKVTIRRMEVPK